MFRWFRPVLLSEPLEENPWSTPSTPEPRLSPLGLEKYGYATLDTNGVKSLLLDMLQYTDPTFEPDTTNKSVSLEMGKQTVGKCKPQPLTMTIGFANASERQTRLLHDIRTAAAKWKQGEIEYERCMCKDM